MATKQANTDDKKEKNSEPEKVCEEQPLPKVGADKQTDNTISPPNQQTNEPIRESSGGDRIDAGPSPLALDRIHEMYVRVSQPTGCESLCTRILEDWPDEEDFLPPVVDFSVEHMLPGWYRSFCASPDCHGDL
ncbi:uncharacterized protein LOC123880132 [Maniola jurtina]|uniref:uncharacterized protein LOC123880132 n=1 Tax=Maniola jurtina TaxID=191418 RepID=UPI001E68CD44|nr:uncharacterized protein LOC123880132 [Maniola jurtina]